MANVTKDQNDRSIQDFFCISGLYGIQQKNILSAIHIPLSITAFLGNVMIIAVLQKPSRYLNPPSKLLLCCLATTDLCVGLISHPLRVIYFMSPDHSKRCHYAEIASNGMAFILGVVSLLTMTAISVDRLLALVLGLRYRQVVTLGRMWIFVAVVWLSIISISTALHLNYNLSASEYIVSTVILLCLTTAMFCYTKIYCTLRRHQAQLVNHQGQPNEGRSPLNIARYRKTVSSALWVQITLVACYLPFGITSVISGTTGWNTPGVVLAWETAGVILMLNSSLNPFIYAWKIKEIRHAVKDTIRQIVCFLS